MSTTGRNHRFSLVRTLILSALGLCTLALSLSPAKAQCLGVDLGFGCAGLGVGSWYGQPYYHGYPYHYGQPYYNQAYYNQAYYSQPYYGQSYYGQPHYGQPYYGYPAYSYPSYRPELGSQ